MKKMKRELVELLNIWAPSGEEEKVVKYAKPILEKLCDKRLPIHPYSKKVTLLT